MKTFLARSAWAMEEGLRLDAATYASGGLEVRDRLCTRPWSWRRLDALSTVYVESRFARVYVRYAQHGTPYITSSDMLLADLKGLLYLSNERTPQMSKLLIREGCTLISCSGTIGRTVYVRAEMDGFAASHDVIRCVPQRAEVAPGYLFAFLSSSQAQAMIRQKTYGNVIQHIEPEHIADMPVPIPDGAFQQRIHDLVTRAAEARTEASHLLDAAGNYFDALAGPIPSSHDHAYAVGLVRRSDLNLRLDAFHHVGWASEARLSGEPLGAIANVTVPGRSKLIAADAGVQFYTGVDLYQVRPQSTKRVAQWLPGVPEWTLQPNTALIQVDGQRYGLMGRPAYVGSRLKGAAASWHMARISSDQLPRIFAFARSEIGRRAIVRQSFGTSVPSITAQLLREVEVPVLPDELASSVEHAFQLRERADADEERAIREVETWLS